MSVKDDLLNELRRLLQSGTISYNSSSAVHDIYEGFVFAQVIETAREVRGARIYFQTVRLSSTKNLVFRASPGRLHSTGQDYTHAVIELGPGIPPLEAHIGVKVLGNSSVEHECDVLVLTKTEASACRSNRASPRANHCVLAIECKYYTSPLDLALGREFAGLKADLGTKPNAVFVSSRTSANVKKYLNARNLTQEFRILPNSQTITHLKSHIREAFKKHASNHNARVDI